MGEARKRGSKDSRIAQACAAQLEQEPINIQCKTCKAVLNGFKLLKHTAAGAAWEKVCDCGAVTNAVVQSKHGTLKRAFQSSVPLMKDVSGKGKKIGVSFIEKNIDSIETGVVRW